MRGTVYFFFLVLSGKKNQTQVLKIFLEDRTVYVEKADISKYASVIMLYLLGLHTNWID